MAAPELELDPPGPGSWMRDAGHFPHPVTRLYASLFPGAFERGTRVSNARYGSLYDGAMCAFPRGFAYFTASLAPSDELPARRAAAERAFAERIWRSDLERWDSEVKPASIAAHLALGEIDVERLDDDALTDHLAACMAHYTAMAEQHHHFNAASTIPLTELVVVVAGWTGRSANEILALVEGASAVSGGEGPQLAAAVAAIRADPRASALLDHSDDLAALRALGGEIGDSVTQLERHVGPRLATGFDLDNPTTTEVPGLLARILRRSVGAGRTHHATQAVADRVAETRAAVPPAERARFDDLLSEARLLWRLRDERGVYSDAWAAGILRRAVLAAGHRLTQGGLLGSPEHLLECDADELLALLRAKASVDGAELERRARERASLRHARVPELLGPPFAPVAPPEGWPVRAAALVGAQALFSAGRSEAGEPVPGAVAGTAASPGTSEGRARVVIDGADLARVEAGDILVMPSTSEAVCVVVPLLAGVVTDHGGLISHAAIVAREVGIPAVVGCGDATSRIRDGEIVRVDGTTGEVVVVGSGS